MTQPGGFDPGPAAARLHAARRGGRRQVLDRLPEAMHPQTMEQGVAVQRALAGLQGVARPAGFKIGATARRMQLYLGLDGPVAGFMAADNLHGSGSTLIAEPFLHPGVECELAVHLVHDLPPGPCTPERARAAVGGLMAAIELVENRYRALPEFGAAGVVADQAFHAAAILGMPDPDWHSRDLAALSGRILVDGVVREGGTGAELMGGPMEALAWLAGSVEAAAFGGLQAGQVVMLGSVCPPVWLDGPANIRVEFDNLPAVELTLVSTGMSGFR